MGFNIKPMTLFLVALSALSPLPCVDASCSGSCAVSGGFSYNFMSDPAFNIGMSSFDEFVRDSLGQVSPSKKSLSSDDQLNNNSSMNQTADDNSSPSGFGVLPVISNPAITTSDNSTVKLGASGMQDKRVSNLVFATFNNKFYRTTNEIQGLREGSETRNTQAYLWQGAKSIYPTIAVHSIWQRSKTIVYLLYY